MNLNQLIGLTGTVDLPPRLTEPVICCVEDFTSVYPGYIHNSSEASALTFDPGAIGEPTGGWDTEPTLPSASLSGDAGTGVWEIGGTNSTNALVVDAHAAGGWVTLTTAGASGDETCILRSGACISFARDTSGDPLPFTFRCRATISTITTSDQVFGVGPYDNTNCVETQGTGSVNIRVASGVVKYEYKTSAATVTAQPLLNRDLTPITVVADQTCIFEIRYDGMGGVEFVVNGATAYIAANVKKLNLAAFDAAVVTAHCGIGSTSAAEKAMSVDYVILLGAASKEGR